MTIIAMKIKRNIVIGSPKKSIPYVTAPTAPIPVQIAYPVPNGIVFTAIPNKPTLRIIPIIITAEAKGFVKPCAGRVFIGAGLKQRPLAGAIDRGGRLVSQRPVGPDLVVLPAPILEESVCLHHVLGDLAQELLLHGAVEALDLPLGLRMAGAAMDGEDVQVHEVALKSGDAPPEAGKLRAVVREDGVGQAVFLKGLDEALLYPGGGGLRFDTDAEPAVIVQDGQRIAARAVAQQKVSFEVRLPHLIAVFLLKPAEGGVLEALFLRNHAVPLEDIAARLCAGHFFTTGSF